MSVEIPPAPAGVQRRIVPVVVSRDVYKHLHDLAYQAGITPGQLAGHVLAGEFHLPAVPVPSPLPVPDEPDEPVADYSFVPPSRWAAVQKPSTRPTSSAAELLALRTRLTLRREELGWSQRHAATYCGYSRGLFSDLESGRRPSRNALSVCVQKLEAAKAERDVESVSRHATGKRLCARIGCGKPSTGLRRFCSPECIHVALDLPADLTDTLKDPGELTALCKRLEASASAAQP